MKKKIIILGIISMFLLTSFAAVSAVEMKASAKNEITVTEKTLNNVLVKNEDYTPHAPITIDGNGDFIPENGVTGGSGTEEDPFIIEGWRMKRIYIFDTTAYFIIRNCFMYSDSCPVIFDGVQNGAMEHCIIEEESGYGFGITIQGLMPLA